jgi:SSS family solute:Na+ symporter
MSSLAGAFNSTAVLFTNDFYKIRNPQANERKLVLVGRLTTTAVVVVAILIVPLVKIISSQIYLFLQSVQAFVSPPITAVFLFGLFSKKINARTAFITLIVGETIGFSRLLIEILVNLGVQLHPALVWILGINFLHFAIFLFVVCLTLIFVLNFYSVQITNDLRINIQYSISESIQELKYNFACIKRMHGLKSNFLLSAFIVIIIIGLWSIWY